MIKQLLEVLKYKLDLKRNVYLDYNATTGVSRTVRIKMNHVLKYDYGNPSSLYGIARRSAEIMEESRQRIADAAGAGTHEIYFTGCATESNNAVLKSLSSHYYPKKKKVISTPIEHPSIMKTLEYLETQGIIVEYCPVDKRGMVIISQLEKMIDGDTFLICCMLANNEIGTIQDIRAISKAARRHGVLVMSDCVQAFGKIPINVHELGIDYASFSAHKLYGPKGVGALYVKEGSPFSPFMHGGHQEGGNRAGTEGLHNIAGFGVACHNIPKLLSHTKRISILKQQCIGMMKEIKPDCIINSPDENSLANTLSITFPGMTNREVMAMLDYHSISVSAGSACSTGDDKPSHVLKAIGLTDKAARETIRISFGCSTTFNEINYLIKVFKEYIEGKNLFINMVTKSQLNELFLLEDDTFILDVRPGFLRKKHMGLPNSNAMTFTSIGKQLHLIPKNKHILVICQHGNLSHIMAYFLKSKGFNRVSSLLSGISGLRKEDILLV